MTPLIRGSSRLDLYHRCLGKSPDPDSPYLSGMRQLLASLLAFVFLLPTLAYWSSTRWQRDHLRREAKQCMLQGIPKESLFRMALPVDEPLPVDFQWVNGDEFRLQGMMYDVITRYQTADSLILMAWADHHEAAFEAELNDLFARLMDFDPFSTHIQHSWSHLLKQLYPPAPLLDHPFVADLKSATPPDHLLEKPGQFNLDPPSPPPRRIG